MKYYRPRKGRVPRRFAVGLAFGAGIALGLPLAARAATLQPTCSVAANVRTCDVYAEQGQIALPAVARLDTGSVADGTQLVFSAVDPGPEGNAITVALDGSNAGAIDAAATVAVTGTDVVVTLATDDAGALSSTASQIEALVNGDPAASALLRALVPSGAGGGVLSTLAATHLAGGTVQAHVWTFTGSSGPATSVGGPTLVAREGETLRIHLHNELGPAQATEHAGDHDLALTVPQQALPPAAAKVAPGQDATYEIADLKPGTSLYEAGASTGTAAADDDVEQQVAMGLYGALVVLPSQAGQAYAGQSSAYDSESVLVLSELDPKLANADDPAGFDMTGYHPSYWLINGHTYDGADSDTIPPIEAAPGDRVLLRYVNAGVYDHSMGILRAHQHVVGYAGVEEKHPYDVVAESVNPGQTMDAVVAVPNTGADGAKYLLSDQGQHLDDAGAGWADASGVQVTTGGMMTFINAAGLPAACYGSTTSKVVVGTLDTHGHVVPASDVTNGQGDLPLSASFATCDPAATISKVELFVDSDGADGAGFALPASAIVDDGMGGGVHHYHLAAGTTIPASQFTGLTTGMHVLLIHAADTRNDGSGVTDTWGSESGDAFTVDVDAPKITGITTQVDPATSTLSVSFTADDTSTGGSDVDVPSAAGYVDDSSHPLAVTPEVPGASGPIVAFTGTASIAGLAAGNHTIHLSAADLAGCPNSSCGNAATTTATVSFTVDTAGPANVGFTIAPNPNNGTLDQAGQPGNVFLDGTFDDSASGGSTIARGEAFIDDVDPPAGPGVGHGFVFLPEDGAWDEPIEKAHMPIPLTEIASLAEGLHHVWVHGKDAAGNWGTLTSIDLVIDKTKPTTALAPVTPINPGAAVTLRGAVSDPTAGGVAAGIDHLEWFRGTDPGPGRARTDLVTNSGGTYSIVLPLSELQPGASNTVNVRALDKAGNWSVVQAITFNVPFPRGAAFVENFDAGLSGWTIVGGTAVGTSAAARFGTTGQGLFVTLPNGRSITTPFGPPVSAYTATFRFNPNRALFGNAVTIVQGLNGATPLFRIQARQGGRNNNPTYSVQASYRSNRNRWVVLPATWAPMSAGWHTLSIGWAAGTTGKLVLKRDGIVLASATVNASALQINTLQLGLIDGLPARPTGTVYFDDLTTTTP